MCNLAGYTGSKRAAPILIDMIRREQYYDAGYSTGIATIHEGKIYTAKVLGDVDALLKQTDAWDFPGTFGIIHSRPGANYVSHAHPFLDRTGNLALCLNGTGDGSGSPELFAASRGIMKDFFDRGFPIRSAVEESGESMRLPNGMGYHDTEPYALMAGDFIDNGMELCAAVGKAIDTLPLDIVTLAIHTAVPGTVAIGRITRPMEIALGDGESYMATTAFAFPEDQKFRTVKSAPTAAVTAVTPGEFRVTDVALQNVRVQDIDPCIYAEVWRRIEEVLKNADRPLTLDELHVREMKDVWDEPLVDCIYRLEDGVLKPYTALTYQILYEMYRRGLVRQVLDMYQIFWSKTPMKFYGFVWNK